MINKQYYSWDDIDWMIDTLARNIAEDCQKSDKTPAQAFKGVYGIPRGGLVMAVMLSHTLKLPYVESLNGMYGEKFLIVDDISDTGVTLERMMNTDVFKYAKIATLNYHKQSVVVPDFWVEEKKDQWIVYPWESD